MAEGPDATGPPRSFNVQTPDGLTIAAQEWGNPDAPAVLFIHGFSQCHLSWVRQYGSELARSFRMITYDLRGHGGSDKPLEATFYRNHKRWADELEAVMDAARLEKPLLVGWSYGGRIIAEYLMEYGDGKIGGIHFVGAFTKVTRELLGPAALAVFKMASQNLTEHIQSTLSFLKQCTSQTLSPDDLQIMLAYSMMVPPEICGHLLGRPAPYEDALKKITVPVLVSHGMEDRVARVAMVDYTTRVVPHAQTSIYHGAGHMPFWEDAPRFNRELTEFVIRCNKR
jgi:pimeloyl-ACP methyl ester carboxylesterase